MSKHGADRRKGRRGLKDLWKLFLSVVGVIAVVQELRKPPDLRTWHGTVGNLVPYDFRKPTFDRFRETYWNPDGPIVSNALWGVGWAVNVGAVKRLFDR